jgi:menaquinone-dependent protoporphyrinogen oxidase
MDVLVAYATKHGSTREVAEAIAAAAGEQGARAQLLRAALVREPVTRYDLVVLGAPLYSGRWHKDAARFLRRHRRDLAGVPVAVFGMGPRNDTEEAWRRSRAQLDKALAKRGWLAPVSVAVFGGVDPPGRGDRPRRDLRDLAAIRAWAAEVAALGRAGTAAAR